MPAVLSAVAMACSWAVVQFLTPTILAAMERRAMRKAAETHKSGPPQ